MRKRNEAIVFLNGELNYKESFYNSINYNDFDIYCADGGANHVYNLNKKIQPKLILGDLDSVSKKVIEHYKSLKVDFEKYSPYKDFTDGELVLKLVSDKYDKVLVLGGFGGRSDHFLTNINLLEKFPNARYEDENEILIFLKKETILKNYNGKTMSLIPLTNIEKLTLRGFQYPLEDKNFNRASSLCASNIIIDEKALVKYEKGAILGIIQK